MRTVQNPESHLKTIQKLIETERAKTAKAKLSFTAPDGPELMAKLQRANSPMIVWQSWSSQAPAGGTLNYNVGIYNPDPVEHGALFGHVFVGAANMVEDVGAALAVVDPQFPRLTQPEFFGLTLPAGGSSSLSYDLKMPAVSPSNYLGNTFLFASVWHDPGTYLDRSLFVFKVV